jgi:hypothetical protein
MNYLYIFEFNRREDMAVWKIIGVNFSQKKFIDLVKKEIPDMVLWKEGYKIKELGRIDHKPGIIAKELFLDYKRIKSTEDEEKEDEYWY